MPKHILNERHYVHDYKKYIKNEGVNWRTVPDQRPEPYPDKRSCSNQHSITCMSQMVQMSFEDKWYCIKLLPKAPELV